MFKSFCKQVLPYGVVCWRLRRAHGEWIDWPLAYFPDWRNRIKRIIKFSLPFGLVMFERRRRFGEIVLEVPPFKSNGSLSTAHHQPRPIRRRTLRAVVVIPVYRETLSETETLSLKQTVSILANHEIRLVCPEGLDTSAYDQIAGHPLPTERFSADYFKGIDGYNLLMTDVAFYERFAKFDYMLICQLDAWVFRDELLEWCAKGYDYIGAPWFENFHSHETNAKLWAVGNGGFSLRRIKRFVQIMRTGVPRELMIRLRIYEDHCFAVVLRGTGYELSVPTLTEAMRFAFERSPAWLYEQTGHHLPFGCHAWCCSQFLSFYSSYIPYRMSAPSGKRLSVITVNFNNLEGLKRTADSVLAQTWRNFEWIIIDGGSTDGSKEYIENVLAPYVAYWCSEPDGGVYFGMNKGIAHASGEYLNFMNSGDCFYGHTTLGRIFSTSSAADVFYGDACYIVEGGTKTLHAPDCLPADFFQYDNICHQAMFIRRQTLGSGYDTNYHLYADWAKWIELKAARRSFRHLPVNVCIYDSVGGISATNAWAAENERRQLGIRNDAILVSQRKFVNDPDLFLPYDPNFAKGPACEFPASSRAFSIRSAVRERRTGRTAVFATYTHDGRIYARDIELLKGLAAEVDNVIVVGDALLLPGEETKIDSYATAICFERHGEYDFGSYRRGCEIAEDMGLLKSDTDLILMNNFCYGWIYPLSDTLLEMAARPCDFWGMSANGYLDVYHIQSYFYYFTAKVVKNGAVGEFLSKVHGHLEFMDVVCKYEVRMTRFLQDRGYSWDTLVPFGAVEMDPTFYPATLLKLYHLPLLKVKCLAGQCCERMDAVFAELKKVNPELMALIGRETC